MFTQLKIALGLAKPERKKVKLPKGLTQLEVVPAKAWWK